MQQLVLTTLHRINFKAENFDIPIATLGLNVFALTGTRKNSCIHHYCINLKDENFDISIAKLGLNVFALTGIRKK